MFITAHNDIHGNGIVLHAGDSIEVSETLGRDLVRAGHASEYAAPEFLQTAMTETRNRDGEPKRAYRKRINN
jgi:hypothetical protein